MTFISSINARKSRKRLAASSVSPEPQAAPAEVVELPCKGPGATKKARKKKLAGCRLHDDDNDNSRGETGRPALEYNGKTGIGSS